MKNSLKALALIAALSGGTEVLASNAFRINQGRVENSTSTPYTIEVNQAAAASCDAPTTATFSISCQVDYSKALKDAPLLTIKRGNDFCVIVAIPEIKAISIGQCFQGPIISNGNINLPA